MEREEGEREIERLGYGGESGEREARGGGGGEIEKTKMTDE